MVLRRFVVNLEARDQVADQLRAGDLLEVRHGDTAMVLAAWQERVAPGVGLWVVVDEEHPASLVARDLATLSYLRDVGPVVIEASSLAAQHAQVVSALLTNDEVNFANDVVTLVGAYNRPAPRSTLVVGSCENDVVQISGTRLTLRAREALDAGFDAQVWTYGD